MGSTKDIVIRPGTAEPASKPFSGPTGRIAVGPGIVLVFAMYGIFGEGVYTVLRHLLS